MLAKNREIQAVVLIDDFVGSGGSAATQLAELGPNWRAALDATEPKLVYVALAGFVAGQLAIESMATEIGLDVVVHLCDPLDEADRVFSDASRAFDNAAERNKARRLAKAAGERLARRHPLGYSG